MYAQLYLFKRRPSKSVLGAMTYARAHGQRKRVPPANVILAEL